MATNSNKEFIAALKEIADPAAAKDVTRYFRPDPNAGSNDNKILGVSIGKIFPREARSETTGAVSGEVRLVDAPDDIALCGREVAGVRTREIHAFVTPASSSAANQADT